MLACVSAPKEEAFMHLFNGVAFQFKVMSSVAVNFKNVECDEDSQLME
jgi:hypothetical protein